LPTVLQIENREDEYNPYVHSPEDNIAHMNLDYWEEQIKATIAITAHLAVPVTYTEQVYFPVLFRSYRGQEDLDTPSTISSSRFRCQTVAERR